MPKKLISYQNNGVEVSSVDVDGRMHKLRPRTKIMTGGRQAGKSSKTMSVENKLLYDILYSYDTPVAAYHREKQIYYITEKKWSQTTTRHIHKWISSEKKLKETIKVPQKTINDISVYGKSESLIDKKDRFEDLIID